MVENGKLAGAQAHGQHPLQPGRGQLADNAYFIKRLKQQVFGRTGNSRQRRGCRGFAHVVTRYWSAD